MLGELAKLDNYDDFYKEFAHSANGYHGLSERRIYLYLHEPQDKSGFDR